MFVLGGATDVQYIISLSLSHVFQLDMIHSECHPFVRSGKRPFIDDTRGVGVALCALVKESLVRVLVGVAVPHKPKTCYRRSSQQSDPPTPPTATGWKATLPQTLERTRSGTACVGDRSPECRRKLRPMRLQPASEALLSKSSGHACASSAMQHSLAGHTRARAYSAVNCYYDCSWLTAWRPSRAPRRSVHTHGVKYDQVTSVCQDLRAHDALVLLQ